MSSLINTKIEDTYTGLLKTSDNLPIDATLKTIQDGNGGNLPIQVSTTGVNFTGTVTGLPAGGVSSIIPGTGITVDQSTGNVTVSATGGGGGGIISQQGPATSYTQATAPGCDFVFSVAQIPANTYTVGDVIELRSMNKISGSTGFVYQNFSISEGTHSAGVAYIAGAQGLVGGETSATAASYYIQKTLHIISATETAVWIPGNNAETQTGPIGGDPIEVYNIDWTEPQTVWYGACIDNSGATLQNFGLLVRKLN